MFGGGQGHYLGEDDILGTHLTAKGGDALGSVFMLGVGGFTTAQALAIKDATAMRTFCSLMRANFNQFSDK